MEHINEPIRLRVKDNGLTNLLELVKKLSLRERAEEIADYLIKNQENEK